MTTGNGQEYRAAIDLGSNSFRLLIAPAGDPGAAVVRETVTVGLGRGRNGPIQPEAMATGLRVLAGFTREMAEHGVPPGHVRACGTEALRRAANRGEFVSPAGRLLGCPVEILSGEEEARLTLAGIRAGMRTPAKDMVVADIGGRSTEIIHCRGRDVARAASIPVGAMHAGLPDAGREEAIAALREAARPDGAAGSTTLILAGGSATTCAAIELGLDPYDPAAVQGFRLTRAMVERLLSRLRNMPRDRMTSIRGLPPDRVPLVTGGLPVILEVMRAAGAGQAVVSDYGLLEGIFLSLGK